MRARLAAACLKENLKKSFLTKEPATRPAQRYDGTEHEDGFNFGSVPVRCPRYVRAQRHLHRRKSRAAWKLETQHGENVRRWNPWRPATKRQCMDDRAEVSCGNRSSNTNSPTAARAVSGILVRSFQAGIVKYFWTVRLTG